MMHVPRGAGAGADFHLRARVRLNAESTELVSSPDWGVDGTDGRIPAESEAGDVRWFTDAFSVFPSEAFDTEGCSASRPDWVCCSFVRPRPRWKSMKPLGGC